MKSTLYVFCTLVLNTLCYAEDVPAPQPLALPPPIVAAKDIPFPGVIQLAVDATDTAHGVFRVHEVIPLPTAGPTVLYFPKWLPGGHSPSGPVDALTGLIVRAQGAHLPWKRDPIDMHAFHIEAPEGAGKLELEFEFTSPVGHDQGDVVMTPEMLNLQWWNVALYPAGYFTRQIPVQPSVTLPAGWQYATALEPALSTGATITFKPVSFETLVDSTLFAGRYFKRIDLDPAGPAPVHLNIVADSADLLAASPEQIEAHKSLVRQAYKVFGSHHYDHYDFLLGLSDQLSGIGLEHHRSSENGTIPTYFTEWDKNAPHRDLLAHEFTHSWNGKFRRGADLWTPDYATPMRDSLLWVYEGQTEYWGHVLAARAGLCTKAETLDALAVFAAEYEQQAGRRWRTLEDTTNSPIASNRRPVPWKSWQRGEDYYVEGMLVWLDADTLIREQSKGAKSLDDFARGFFGVRNGSYVPLTYQFEDVVAALNAVQPYDWATFLRTRLQSHGPGAPLDGLTRGGYRLVYTATASEYSKAVDTAYKKSDFNYSVGFSVDNDGNLSEVIWESPAYKAGLNKGVQLMAVNGRAYTVEVLVAAIKAAQSDPAKPINLLVKHNDRFGTVQVDYHGGLRYPHLERIAGTPARLDDILASRK